MQALKGSFTSDFGLMGAAGIAFMPSGLVRHVVTHVREEEASPPWPGACGAALTHVRQEEALRRHQQR